VTSWRGPKFEIAATTTPSERPAGLSYAFGSTRIQRELPTEFKKPCKMPPDHALDLPAKPRKRSWTREEVILALDLYLAQEGLGTLKERAKLSELLRAWPLEQRLAAEDPTFRNEPSVRNKLYNLQYLDTLGEKGRKKGGVMTEAVWGDMAGEPGRVAAEASVIRQAMADLSKRSDDSVPDDDIEADETSVVVVTHRRRERDRKIVTRKREKVLSDTGALACEACGFDSEERFGIKGIIECHHLKPVAELEPGQRTRLSDLRLVCPNCHRLIHKNRPWLTWSQLTSLVESA
jgi:5-methylcytosine-specific restriction protein A